MHPAIYELARQRQVDPASIDAFMKSHSFPIVEDSCVTFIYQGEADAVVLEHWIIGLPSSQPFTRMPGSDIWFLIQEVPEGSRIEYRFVVVKKGKREFVLDPLNPLKSKNPAGPTSVLHAKDYIYPKWAMIDPEAREGSFDEFSIASEAFEEERNIKVYIPARFRKRRRYPLLVVNDGEGFLQYAKFKNILNNLIYNLEIAPMVVALYTPKGIKEYENDFRYCRFIVDELVPEMEKRFPLIQRRTARGLMGASYGALGALATAWYYPAVFQRLMLLSSSFAFPREDDYDVPTAVDPVLDFFNGLPEPQERPSEKVFMSCGVYESRIHENRSLLTNLHAEGIDVRYDEVKDGHNWGNWRDRMRDGLSWLFPGPLWMVYE
jgi:enterochelin esterase family protein